MKVKTKKSDPSYKHFSSSVNSLVRRSPKRRKGKACYLKKRRTQPKRKRSPAYTAFFTSTVPRLRSSFFDPKNTSSVGCPVSRPQRNLDSGEGPIKARLSALQPENEDCREVCWIRFRNEHSDLWHDRAKIHPLRLAA